MDSPSIQEVLSLEMDYSAMKGKTKKISTRFHFVALAIQIELVLFNDGN
jgi:hypothetical protein